MKNWFKKLFKKEEVKTGNPIVEAVEKVNAILLEPENIQTVIPACKDCIHCRI